MMATAIAGRRRRQRGSAILESGLCLSIFLMLFVTILDYGRWAYINNLVPYLAREGTRYAIVHGSTSTAPTSVSGIQTYVQGKAAGIATADLNVAVTFSGAPGSTASVTVTGYFSPLTPWLMTPGSRPGYSASSNMTVLQ
ncbi:MAG TPA: TadE/TadG family type IV pilus assembly protein [Bryobacteraceae bacterium]|jgi:Flp pilus assembly protein TadG